jgi:hypothetical protein
MGERRWYGMLSSFKGPTARVQIESPLVERYGQRSTTLPEPIVRMAADEYNRHYDQSYERLQERGGLGVLEIVALLADRCERLGGAVPDAPSVPEWGSGAL